MDGGCCFLVVYADVFVIVNLYIDFFLLWCVKRFLHLQARSWRLVAGALMGSLCALAMLLPLPHWAAVLLGGAGALAASAGAFCPMKGQQLLRAWLCLWLFSFLLAGFFLFLLRTFSPGNIAVLGSAVYLDLSLPMLFLFTVLAYGGFWAFQRLFPRDASPLRLCTLRIENGGAVVELTAKADTGNALREPFSGLPVIVCEEKALTPVIPSSGLRVVPFSTLGAEGLLRAFKAEKVALGRDGKPLDCWLALYGRPLSSGQFAALFNPHAFE